MPRRNMPLDWLEMQQEIALIERRARAMRAEAAWSIARAVRAWVATGLGRVRSSVRSQAQTRIDRTGHAA